MTDKIHLRSFGRRGLLQGLLALPVLLAFRGARPAPAKKVGQPDDIVEISGWILRRSDLS